MTNITDPIPPQIALLSDGRLPFSKVLSVAAAQYARLSLHDQIMRNVAQSDSLTGKTSTSQGGQSSSDTIKGCEELYTEFLMASPHNRLGQNIGAGSLPAAVALRAKCSSTDSDAQCVQRCSADRLRAMRTPEKLPIKYLGYAYACTIIILSAISIIFFMIH
ncbi:MAG: hypothetical protein IAF58_13780 [Leptolyngbya sp.]|nr:hypothetical protein [Candidatus Melainabacteria bacterium]